MKRLVLLVLLSVLAKGLNAQAPTLPDVNGKDHTVNELNANAVSVFFFLAPDCPLCQKYTLPINNIVKQFSNQNVRFYAVFPGKAFNTDSIVAFAKKYNLNMPLLLDKEYRFTCLTAATVTPQAIVFDDRLTQRYSGKIDNWYETIAKRRTVITEHYLSDAIQAILAKTPIKVARTTPIGCFIF